jgi:GGDEF domain-containing protein
MGLLEKALQFYNLQAEKKTAGLLAGAALYSKTLASAEPFVPPETDLTGTARGESRLRLDPKGLLAKAERYYAEGAREGLFAQAQRFGTAHVPRGMKVGKMGLLKKALQLREALERVSEEAISVEAEVSIPEEVVLAEETVVAEERAPAAKVTVEEKEAQVTSRKAVKAKPAERPPREEAPVEVKTPEEAPAVEKIAAALQTPAPEPWIPIQVLEQLLEQNDAMGILGRITGLVSGEGYDVFFSAMLETLVRLAGGKSGVLVTLHRRGYREETSVTPRDMGAGKKGSGRRKISYGKSSQLVRYVQGNPDAVVTPRSIKDEKVLEDCGALEAYEPWSIVPIAVGEHLYGFFLIGNLPKRPAVSGEHLLSLVKLTAFHLAPWIIERNSGERIDTLESEKEQLSSLLQLHDYSILSSFSIQEIFKQIAVKFEIGAGVVVAGWDGKGPPQVRAAVGLSERGVRRYRVSKSDRAIKAAMREGSPDVPGDLEKRLKSFLKEDQEAVNTAVIVPVQFCGKALGVVIIHRMKGVATRVSGRSKSLLMHIAQSLVPFLLYDRMVNLEPYEVFEELLEREAARARKERSSLHVVAFRVKNFKAIIKEKGFDRYRKLLERFSNLIREKVGDRGLVHILSLNKVVFLLVMKDADEATHLVVEAKSAVGELLEKEKSKQPLSLQPLRTIYPNESRSVAEILQLIE